MAISELLAARAGNADKALTEILRAVATSSAERRSHSD